MFKRTTIAALALTLAAPALFAQKPNEAVARKASLVAGAPAPALSIEKWVKGSPVASFEKGKVYVVEFWATWCGPCIASMPHLSALQREYKDKLTIIGVTTQDPHNDLPAVEKMVADKGDGMGYTVAWDKGHDTSDAFMKAADQHGIPCSFVIDRDGKVVYIGHPMFLDEPLEQVVAGTWDVEKGNAAIADAKAKLGEIGKLMQTDPKKAVAEIESFEAKHPKLGELLADMKFPALLAAEDYTAAYALGSKLVDQAIASKNVSTLNEIAWQIVDPKAKVAKRDLALAKRAASKAVELTKEQDAAVLDTLARAYYWDGDVAKAIEIQKKAIAVATEPEKKDLEKTLAEYGSKTAQ